MMLCTSGVRNEGVILIIRVSVTKILEFASEALISFGDLKGRERTCNGSSSKACLGYLSFAATSLVRRKYGSRSIAHGMRQCTFDAEPNL